MFVMFMVFMLLIVFHLVVVFIKLFDVVIIIIIVVVCGREKHYRNGLGGMPDSFPIALYRLFERDMYLFSASCMLNSIQFDIALSAEKDTKVLVIPSDVYRGIMDISAPLANYTNELMATRFSDVMWLVDQIMWKIFDRRLATFLINEANIEGTNKLKITHEIISNHLGSPREVVTRMLKYFVSEGLIALSRGTIEILDMQGLEQIADG